MRKDNQFRNAEVAGFWLGQAFMAFILIHEGASVLTFIVVMSIWFVISRVFIS